MIMSAPPLAKRPWKAYQLGHIPILLSAIFACSVSHSNCSIATCLSTSAYVLLASLPFCFQLVFSFHATTVTKVIPFAAQRTELKVKKLYL